MQAFQLIEKRMEVLKVDFRSSEAASRLAASFRTTGFAVITDHPIKRELIETVYADWKKFFADPSKTQYTFDKQTQAGYFPFKSENAKDSKQKDLKEFFHIYPSFALPLQIGPATVQLRDQLLDLGKVLLRWIDEETPAQIRRSYSMPLEKMSDGSPKNLFRIIHYPPLTGGEEAGAIRAAAHEDINLITLLPASTAMGLQVKDIEGRWHDVPGNFGDIVVNVGDMLQMASDGFYKSTTHQVINPPGELAKQPRYSMPLFVHPHEQVKLSSRTTAGEYLHERLREIGLA